MELVTLQGKKKLKKKKPLRNAVTYDLLMFTV